MARLGKFQKRDVYPLLHHLGLSAIARPLLSGQGAIFCFHRVLPDDDPLAFRPSREFAVTPDVFRSMIEHIQSAGYDIISISEMHQRLSAGDTSRKFVCLTFDDGYLDNYEIAQPICAEYGVPMTIYVTTGAIDDRTTYWWYGLEDLVAANTIVALTHRGDELTFQAADKDGKHQTYEALETALRSASEDEQIAMMVELEDRYGIDFNRLSRDNAMSWEMIVELDQRDDVEIGAHTVNHKVLAELSDEQAREEIAQSRQVLEDRLSRPVTHFAYPYGHVGTCGEREFEICRELGFSTAVTTNIATLKPDDKSRLLSLPRLPVWADETRATAALKLSGGLELVHRIRRTGAAA